MKKHGITQLIFLCIMLLCFVNKGFAQFETYKKYADLDTLDIQKKGGQIYHNKAGKDYLYFKPKWNQPFVSAPANTWKYTKHSFRKDNWLNIIAITASTAALAITWDINGKSVNLDQKVIDCSEQFGRYIHLDPTNMALDISPIKGLPLFIPQNLNTSMYYLGDGITDLLIDGSFLAYGLIKNDARALQTSTQIFEGMMVVGVITQVMKHISGRQTDSRSTQAGGKWQWFPNQITYTKSVPTYDAFPSGHLCTSMVTFTIIAENYPEYKKIIWPIGIATMTTIGYAMLNNGVHWLSDYPLALAMGYGFGKLVVARHRTILVKDGETPLYQSSNSGRNWFKKIKLTPKYSPYGIGVGAIYNI